MGEQEKQVTQIRSDFHVWFPLRQMHVVYMELNWKTETNEVNEKTNTVSQKVLNVLI